MMAGNHHKTSEFDSSFAANASDALMVSRMRMVLAISVLLAVFIEPSGLSGHSGLTRIVFIGYLFHSVVVYLGTLLDAPISQSLLIHRLDVLWFALIVFLTGGVDSFFFIFFFFAILTSSFRWGLEEGQRITIISALLFVVCALITDPNSDLPQLLLRTTFLLATGYMSAQWGESKVRLLRQLALLRDVCHLSNPRFGVDRTITRVLEQTQQFFKADSCTLVMHDTETGAYTLRTIKDGNTHQSVNSDLISAEAAMPLFALPKEYLFAYTRPFRAFMSFLFGESLAYQSALHRWVKHDMQACKNLAEFLNARSFISVPLSLRKQEGRMYVVSNQRGFSKADALFLSHIAVQAFPVIENIELLDKMASNAAFHERKKIALDLHDTAIQPYIGLKLGLSAIQNKASSDNPVRDDIDKLVNMAAKVIDDLRRYVVTFKNGLQQTESIFLVVLRQQAAHVKEFYGIDISVDIEGEHQMSDRLTTEVLQLVREGLSNICKHTLAQRGAITVQYRHEWLTIHIENENLGSLGREPVAFIPKSMTERAAELGGTVHVTQAPGINTIVHVEIPV